MDPIGGINPNPNETPQPDVNPAMPQQPQPQPTPQFVDPTQAQPQMPPTQDSSSFGSVPMTDPNAPMAPPQPQQPTDPQFQAVDSMLSPAPAPVSAGGSNKSKMIIFAAIGVVLILAAGVGGYFVGYSSGESAGKQAADAAYQEELARQQAATDDTASEPDELDLSELIDPDYSADESLEGQIGETITSADGFVLRVNNIERNYSTDDPAYVVDETKELVKVNFQMGNATKAKTMDISSQTSFKLIDSTGSEVLPANISEYDGKFDVTKLDPGTQSSASIVFEVTKDDVPLQFSRKQPYRITNQNREVTFVTLITIAE